MPKNHENHGLSHGSHGAIEYIHDQTFVNQVNKCTTPGRCGNISTELTIDEFDATNVNPATTMGARKCPKAKLV